MENGPRLPLVPVFKPGSAVRGSSLGPLVPSSITETNGYGQSKKYFARTKMSHLACSFFVTAPTQYMTLNEVPSL